VLSAPFSELAPKKVICIEAAKEMLQILQESEANYAEEITMGGELRFQYPYLSRKCLQDRP
jgi:phage FluMu protein gp41